MTTTYGQTVARPKHGLKLQSYNSQHISQDLLNKIKLKVDVTTYSIVVNKVKKAKGEKVVISCNTENDRKTLNQAITG